MGFPVVTEGKGVPEILRWFSRERGLLNLPETKELTPLAMSRSHRCENSFRMSRTNEKLFQNGDLILSPMTRESLRKLYATCLFNRGFVNVFPSFVDFVDRLIFHRLITHTKFMQRNVNKHNKYTSILMINRCGGEKLYKYFFQSSLLFSNYVNAK